MDEQYVVPQCVVPDDGVSRQSAADLLHQFALAALPEIIRAHPGYAAKTVAVEAYSVASYMVEQGKRAEMEVRNPKFDEAEAARINAIAEERMQKMAQHEAVKQSIAQSNIRTEKEIGQ